MSIIRQYQSNTVYFLIFFGGRNDYLRFIFEGFPFVSLGMRVSFRRISRASLERCTPSMAAEEVTVVKSQNRRSPGSFRNGLVWDRGRFFIILYFYHDCPPGNNSYVTTCQDAGGRRCRNCIPRNTDPTSERVEKCLTIACNRALWMHNCMSLDREASWRTSRGPWGGLSERRPESSPQSS